MNYVQIKKIDEESLQKLTEGSGPSDRCLCALLSPPEETKKGIGASIKRAFASFGQNKREKRKRRTMTGQKSVDIPLSFTKGGKGIYTTKEVVQRKSPCGKCGCDNERVVLKHSFANIRITSPDVSSICPCPSDCLPDKDKLLNNIKVTIERVGVIDVDSVDSEFSLYELVDRQVVSEPVLERRKMGQAMTDSAGEWSDGSSEWSSGED